MYVFDAEKLYLLTSITPNESMKGKFVAIVSNSSTEIEPSLLTS